MPYVITCGDEGVQINEGTRLAFIGAGFELPEFSKAVTALKKVFGADIRIAANEENPWVKEKLDLSTWEQTNASMQQHIQVVADENDLQYAGLLPFADPKELEHDIKGHMVRPKGVHIANHIRLTLAGGEQTYHLGQYVISADWVAAADSATVKAVIEPQITFYNKLAGIELPIMFENEGELGAAVAEKNRKALEKIGITEST